MYPCVSDRLLNTTHVLLEPPRYRKARNPCGKAQTTTPLRCENAIVLRRLTVSLGWNANRRVCAA
jgi:hypothetical protein